MAAALKYEEYYTVDDYIKWEGDWELIGGMAYAMSPFALPSHQRINGKIFKQLDELLENCKECKALIETEVYFSKDTVVRPDSFVICYPLSERLTKAPIIIFEVVSKASSKKDEILKFSIYESEKVFYYVLVYPDLKKAKIYKLSDGKYEKEADIADEKYRFDFKKCKIDFDFSKIWNI